MNKLLKIGIILVVIGFTAAAFVWKFYVNKPHDNIEKATPAYSIRAEEIWKQYTIGVKTADSLFTGKVIELSGTLNRAEKTDSLIYVVFVMEADSMFGDKTIRCEMLQKFNDEATVIITGTPVKIKGFCNGFDGTDVKFNKCSIIK